MTDFKCLSNLIEQLRQIEKKKIKILFELFDSLPQLLTNDIHNFLFVYSIDCLMKILKEYSINEVYSKQS